MAKKKQETVSDIIDRIEEDLMTLRDKVEELENGYYRVGGRTLGSNERDVIDMCQSDKDFFYGFIKVEVDKVITEPSEKLDDMTKEDVTEVVTEKIQEIKKNRTKKAAIVDALTV